MNKILLVEDDRKLSDLMKEYLTQHGYLVNQEYSGDKAVYRILHEDYSLVILDVNLPELNGLQICKLVRKSFQGSILILTAREGDEDHITGLEWGADDYINKPIQPNVLLARIKAISRRQSSLLPNQLIFGNLEINLEKRDVIFKNKLVELKPSEFDLLALLAINAGHSLTRNNIMNALRGIDHDGIDRSIDLRISYLRSKLGDNMENPFKIKTVRGKGYVFQPDVWK